MIELLDTVLRVAIGVGGFALLCYCSHIMCNAWAAYDRKRRR